MKPDELLKELAFLFDKKSKEYGEGYKNFGEIIFAAFPQGIILNTPKGFARFGILNMMFSKLHRYCNNFHTNGHRDSLKDLSVYAAMLAELDEEE
jgi:hypothetical protein